MTYDVTNICRRNLVTHACRRDVRKVISGVCRGGSKGDAPSQRSAPLPPNEIFGKCFWTNGIKKLVIVC